MIDNVLGTKTNIQILRFFTRFQNQFFSAGEISNETGAGVRNVYDSLKCLSYDPILTIKRSQGKTYYSFIVNNSVNEQIALLFNEERKKFYIRNISRYKLLSEIESKIFKIAGLHLVDIILFGSVAKGTDTQKSDIDICVLIDEEKEELKKEIRNITYEALSKKEIQIHVFTSKEFVLARQSKNPLIENILREGMPLKIGR